jgi:cytochrome b involved in lipid metabolism
MSSDPESLQEEDRKMNDSTMPMAMAPPAARPKASSSSSSSSSAPASGKVDGAVPPPRKKTGVRKGFGLSDWSRLLHVSKDLAQRRGQPIRRIRWDEIRQHSSVHDGWIVLKGKVYCISPYLAYHPGGERIMKPVLGKDATALFDKYHQWINEEP